MRWRKIKQTRPGEQHAPKTTPVRFASLRTRAVALITDIFMIGMPITLLIMILFGHDQMMHSAGGIDVIMDPAEAKKHAPNPLASLTQVVLYAVTFILFWHTGGQTPGKKMMKLKVVDARSYQTASWGNLIIRFFGYFLSALTLIGFFTGMFRHDKRALHDLISNTAVIEA